MLEALSDENTNCPSPRDPAITHALSAPPSLRANPCHLNLCPQLLGDLQVMELEGRDVVQEQRAEGLLE